MARSRIVTRDMAIDIRLTLACGISFKETARRLGLSDHTIRYHARGVTLYGPPKPKSKHLAAIYALRLQRLSFVRIAEALDISPAAAWNHSHHLPVQAAPVPRPRTDPERTRRLLAAVAADADRAALADRFGYANRASLRDAIKRARRQMREAA